MSGKTFNFAHLVGTAFKDAGKASDKAPTKFTLITGGEQGKNGKTIPKAFHNVVDWSDHALGLKAGDQVEVKGWIQYSSWDDKKTGEKKYKTEIVVQEIKHENQKSAKHISDEEISRSTEITDEDLPF